MEHKNKEFSTPKRSDVGYKRPPAEHQFKIGQKPPPRKARAQKPLKVSQSLARILAEERRIKRGGKAHWYPNGYLLIEVAFQLAEEGNSTVARALAEYLVASEQPDAPNNQPLFELDPDGPPGTRVYVRRVRI